MKRLLKRVPVLHAAYRGLFRVGAPGRWLYRPETLEWMGDRDLRGQLPAPFRAFALYCRAQSFSGLPVVLGPTAFHLARWAHLRGGRGALRLEVAGRTIYLDARDPRMLQVPGELVALTAPDSILRHVLSNGDSFIDVGANHGAFSVAAAAVVGGRGAVVAFEPQPVLAELLNRSLASGGWNNFTVYAHACSDADGEAEFYVPHVSSGSAGLHAEFSGRVPHDRIRVRLIRLDGVLEPLVLPGSVLLKLDVEGHEPAVLRGAAAFIRERKPRILMEVNPNAMARVGTTVDGLRALLAHLGCQGYRPLGNLGRRFDLDTLAAAQHDNTLFEFG
jgi:FkbM family methyltransferase